MVIPGIFICSKCRCFLRAATFRKVYVTEFFILHVFNNLSFRGWFLPWLCHWNLRRTMLYFLTLAKFLHQSNRKFKVGGLLIILFWSSNLHSALWNSTFSNRFLLSSSVGSSSWLSFNFFIRSIKISIPTSGSEFCKYRKRMLIKCHFKISQKKFHSQFIVTLNNYISWDFLPSTFFYWNCSE